MKKLLKNQSKVITYATAIIAANAIVARADRLHPFQGPSGPGVWNQGIQKEHIGVHYDDDEFWTEGWYFMVQLEGGAYLFNHFVISNAGFGDFSGAVESTIVYPDGKVVFEKERVSRKKMSYDNDSEVPSVTFGEMGSLRGVPGKFNIKVAGEKIAYSFEVSNQAPGWRPGNDGKAYFGEDKKTFYDFTVLAPNGKANGTVTIEGKDLAIKDGMTYADHSHQTHPGHKMAQRLFSMRDFTGNNATDLLVFVPPKDTYGPDGRVANLVIANGNSIKFAAHNMTTTEKEMMPDPEETDYLLPKTIELKNVDGDPAFSGKITLKKQIQRQNAIADATFIERTAMKMFGLKPILYRFMADYEIIYSGGESRGEGLVEYMILFEED